MGGFIMRWRRPIIILLVIMVVSLSLSYTARVRGHVVALSNIISTVVSPAASSLTYVGHEVGVGTSTAGQLFSLQRENQKLKQQLVLYTSMRLQVNELIADNSRLRGLLNMKTTLKGWKLQSASVISRNPNSWFDTVSINRGSSSGIHPGMAVIVPEGVVGRVIAVSPVSSTVMLVLDPNSGVGAMDVRSQSAGVVQGGDSVHSTVTFQLFSHRPDITPGDAVVTSGYSQYYPKGLLIGQVQSVAKTGYGLTESAVVVPSVNFNQLQSVLVVESHPSGTSVPPIYGGTR